MQGTPPTIGSLSRARREKELIEGGRIFSWSYQRPRLYKCDDGVQHRLPRPTNRDGHTVGAKPNTHRTIHHSAQNFWCGNWGHHLRDPIDSSGWLAPWSLLSVPLYLSVS